MPLDSFPNFSDVSKPTGLLESWGVNATERSLLMNNQPHVREGCWIRKIKLTVYGAGGGSDTSGIDLSQLRINFEVHKQNRSMPNLLDCKIYNLSRGKNTPNTEGKMKQYRRVQLAAGYEHDNYGMIFDGGVLLYIQGKENPTDSYIQILAGDQLDLNSKHVVLDWPAGTSMKQRATDQLQQAGIPVGEIQLKDDLPTLRSVAYIGMLDKGLRTITNATNSDFWIDDGKAYIIPWDGYRKGEIVELSPQTGLVGIPKVTPQGIEAECLLNPKLRLGGLVHIKTDLLSGVPYLPGSNDDEPWAGKDYALSPGAGGVPVGQANEGGQFKFSAAETSPTGIYKILLLDHVGDTRGTPWYSKMVCAAAGANGALLNKINPGTALQRSRVSPYDQNPTTG